MRRGKVVIHASSYMYVRLVRQPVEQFVVRYLSDAGTKVFQIPVEAVEILNEGAIEITTIQVVLPFEADNTRILAWHDAVEDLLDDLKRTFFTRGAVKASVVAEKGEK